MRRSRLGLLLVFGMLAALLPVGAAPVAAADDHILLTEIVVTPTAGEFVEIHNPTAGAIDLSNYYLTDATFADDGTYYYSIVTGTNAGGGGSGDFHARFPAGASIDAGEYQTVAMTGSIDFVATYGLPPTYELFEDDPAADAVPDMLEALPGSINNQGGLTNAGEVVVLYLWDGASDLVTDVDYAVWGDKDEAVDKTGVAIDGPDADTDATAYQADTAIASQDVVATGAHASGDSFQRTDLTEGTEVGSGGNGIGGDDETSENLATTWVNAAATPGAAYVAPPPPPPPPPPVAELVINEIIQNPAAVADSAGEWFEIHNPTSADVDIDGWTIADNDNDSHVITNGGPLVVPAGGYLVLGNNADPGTNGGVTVAYSYPGSSLFLSNGADEVVLLDGSLAEVDRVEYDDGVTFPDPSGASMALIDPALDNNDGTNWCTSSTPYGDGDLGTPGAANDCGAPEPEPEPTEYKIYQIQGSGAASPYDGQEVVTEGVVVADFQDSDQLNGFFLQDPMGDDNPMTSDGIFVFEGGSTVEVSVGDLVQVEGVVDEYDGFTEITTPVTVTNLGPTTPLAATPVSLPWGDGEQEQYEGMLLTFLETLFVTDTYNLHRYGEVFLSGGDVVEQPTNEFGGGTPNMDALAADNMARTILLDDASTVSDPRPIPFLREDDTLRAGDTVAGLTAAMSYGFGEYRLMPVGDVEFAPTNPRPAVPDVGGSIRVGSMNVLNFWTTIGCGDECRGAQTEDQLAAQTEKLVAALRGMNADIIGLQEVENTGFVDGVPSHEPIRTLLDAMNEAEVADGGHAVWAWIGELDYYNTYPIRNEILYRTDKVRVGAWAPVTIEDRAFDSVRPGNDEPVGRPPVAQTFEVLDSGATFTVVVNHLKSKGSECDSVLDPATGDEWLADPNTGDGQGNCNLTRVAQAQRVLQFVDELVEMTGDPDVLVLGDMNAYLEEDPIHTLETGLVNLAAAFDDDPYSYTYFNRNDAPYIGRGLLDHALGTASVFGQATGTEVWHINADEPRFQDWYDPTITAPGAYRASDHDPVIVGLALDGTAPDVEAEFDRVWTSRRTGLFKVDFSCVDTVDPDPTCVGEINGIAVEDGQKVFLIKARGRSWHKVIRGILYIKAPEFVLTVTGTDDAGNSAEATATPRFKTRWWWRLK